MNVTEIMSGAAGICGRDTIEAITIRTIAETHGGRLADGSKDKISTLEPETESLEGKIRPRLIASILRLADELADDKTRASSTLLKKGTIPKKSEVFHAFSMCLDSVVIDHKESSIKLRFAIPDNFTNRKFGKMDHEVYLIDEIYERLLKMHQEIAYCMRFCKSSIDIESIRVHIEFYNSSTIRTVHEKMVFDVKERGYPASYANIYEMCPELSEEGNKKDGLYFSKKIIVD